MILPDQPLLEFFARAGGGGSSGGGSSGGSVEQGRLRADAARESGPVQVGGGRNGQPGQ